MLKITALLFPVFVSLFWAIILHGDKKKNSIPRNYLANFMVLMVILFTVKFFQYLPLPTIYPYFDIIHLYAGCFVYPVYHIYFRLLTVDEHFSWKAHYRYLIIPFLLVTIYAIGVFLTPANEYSISLFDRHAFPNSPRIQFLNIMRIIINYYILFQVVENLIRNNILIRKYGGRAEQFYSEIQDGKYNNARILNYMIVIQTVVTMICYMIFKRHPSMVILFPTLYAVIAYMIGYMGYKQKPINPTFELITDSQTENNSDSELTLAQKTILHKLSVEFKENKIYLNSQLNILDVVQVIGTNRSYISGVINRQYNQNFCSFVNSYRLEELYRVYAENSNYSNETLAERCGFGSVNSLKRAIYSKTGMTINEWKNEALLSKKVG